MPDGVTITQGLSEITVKGPKGELVIHIPDGIRIINDNGLYRVARNSEDKKHKALHGLVRAKLANAIKGVTKGWDKYLELHGVGYRATISGKNLVLSVGFSHPVTVVPPDGVVFRIQDGKIVVEGIDKELVGHVASDIRKVKKPEPYKGKGIRYVGEYVRKKAGKAAKAVGGGA